MTDVDRLRQALDELKLRLSRGDLGREEYRQLREEILGDLSSEQLRALGVGAASTPGPLPGTPTPAPPPTPAGGGIPGPSGGSGKGVRTRRATLAEPRMETGDVLADRWRIVRELGRGGFGVVFEAEDLRLEKTQAVKVLDPAMVARPDLLKRFRREVALTRELVHPRVVRVFEYVEQEAEGLALFSMEYVKGSSVRLLLEAARGRKEAIPIGLSLAIVEEVLEALEAAHGAGVIHRDVTPANILLSGGSADALLEGGALGSSVDPQVKLVDFGIAGAIERSELSQKSRVLGTAAYVAPEVLDPSAEVTPAADLYGAGAVLYELLTGKLPLGRFEDPSVYRKDVPKDVDDLVLSLLSPVPGRRPSSREAMQTVAALRTEAEREVARVAARRRLRGEMEEGLTKGDEAVVRRALTALSADIDAATSSRAREFLTSRERKREIDGLTKALGLAIASEDEERARQEAGRLRSFLGNEAARNDDLRQAARWLEQKERDREQKEEARRAAEAEAKRREEAAREKAEQARREWEEADRQRRQAEQRQAEQWQREAAERQRIEARAQAGHVEPARAADSASKARPSVSLVWLFVGFVVAAGIGVGGLKYHETTQAQGRLQKAVAEERARADQEARDRQAAEQKASETAEARERDRVEQQHKDAAAAEKRKQEEEARQAEQAAQKKREAAAVAEAPSVDVWRDPTTGLMWAKRDNGSDVTWVQADQYCRAFGGGGYHDWRLPTMNELEPLFDKNRPEAGNIRSPLTVTGWWVWSSEKGGSSEAWNFDFFSGHRHWNSLGYSPNHGALCVRRPRG